MQDIAFVFIHIWAIMSNQTYKGEYWLFFFEKTNEHDMIEMDTTSHFDWTISFIHSTNTY